MAVCVIMSINIFYEGNLCIRSKRSTKRTVPVTIFVSVNNPIRFSHSPSKMASRVFRLPVSIALRHYKSPLAVKNNTMTITKRHFCYSDTGAIIPKPETIRFGVSRVLGTSIPFLLLGSYISMEFAALLEEHDLFVPDDDDDD